MEEGEKAINYSIDWLWKFKKQKEAVHRRQQKAMNSTWFQYWEKLQTKVTHLRGSR